MNSGGLLDWRGKEVEVENLCNMEYCGAACTVVLIVLR